MDTLGAILTATWNGDTTPLETLLQSREAADLAQGSAMAALAWLTVTNHVPEARTRDILGALPDALPPQEGDEVRWAAWADTISALGLTSLEDTAAEVLLSGVFDRDAVDVEAFQADLADAAANADAVRQEIARSHLQPLNDAVQALTDLREQEEQARDEAQEGDPGVGAASAPEAEAPSAPEPHTNPYRDVGRNDPCPCGSGHKFKKCCAAA